MYPYCTAHRMRVHSPSVMIKLLPSTVFNILLHTRSILLLILRLAGQAQGMSRMASAFMATIEHSCEINTAAMCYCDVFLTLYSLFQNSKGSPRTQKRPYLCQLRLMNCKQLKDEKSALVIWNITVLSQVNLISTASKFLTNSSCCCQTTMACSYLQLFCFCTCIDHFLLVSLGHLKDKKTEIQWVSSCWQENNQ